MPCYFPNASYVTGSTFLFDIETDPFEERDVAAENPDVVAKVPTNRCSDAIAQQCEWGQAQRSLSAASVDRCWVIALR